VAGEGRGDGMYMRDKRNTYNILVANSKEKRPKCKWEHNIKVFIHEKRCYRSSAG
jgi:hypothetical protein